jgi:hypothetical protein
MLQMIAMTVGTSYDKIKSINDVPDHLKLMLRGDSFDAVRCIN